MIFIVLESVMASKRVHSGSESILNYFSKKAKGNLCVQESRACHDFTHPIALRECSCVNACMRAHMHTPLRLLLPPPPRSPIRNRSNPPPPPRPPPFQTYLATGLEFLFYTSVIYLFRHMQICVRRKMRILCMPIT